MLRAKRPNSKLLICLTPRCVNATQPSFVSAWSGRAPLRSIIAKAAANRFDLPGKVGGDAGKILQGVLGGGTGTNAAPSTNNSTAGSVLQGLQGILGGGKSNSPATTNKPATGGGLFDIFKK